MPQLQRQDQLKSRIARHTQEGEVQRKELGVFIKLSVSFFSNIENHRGIIENKDTIMSNTMYRSFNLPQRILKQEIC